jgi:hypothetical protein
MNIKRVIGIAISLLGCLISLVAMGAAQLGLDRDQGWGPARLFLLGTGLLLILFPHIRMLARLCFDRITKLSVRYIPGIGPTFKSIKRYVARMNELPMTGEKINPHPGRRTFWINLQLSAIFLLSVAVFTFLISVGRWTTWLVTTEHFHLLAAGFRSGHTYLAIEPDPALVELENPYPFENREHINQLWDASLYNGRYYLYWGPAPALVALAIESAARIPMDDPRLTWLFLVGEVFISLLILRDLWVHEFAQLPAWSIVPPALAVSLSNPLPWVMSRPAVYEAAIASGQFFLLAAILSILVLSRRPPGRSCIMAIPGTLSILALGSRITLLPVVLFITLVFLIRRFRQMERYKKSKRHDFLFGVGFGLAPILLGLAALGVYNYVRFGSLLEFGHRYQLTLGQFGGVYAYAVSASNILPNIYNYLVNSFRVIEAFPFIKAHWGEYSIPILRATASIKYYTEQISGVLITTPVILFSVLPLATWGRAVWEKLEDLTLRQIISLAMVPRDWGWLYLTLLGSSFLAFTALLIFSYATMRYLLDFLPVLLLASSIGFAFCLQQFVHTRLGRNSLALMGLITSAYSATIGLLLGGTGYFANFEHFNPRLFEIISRFFTR